MHYATHTHLNNFRSGSGQRVQRSLSFGAVCRASLPQTALQHTGQCVKHSQLHPGPIFTLKVAYARNTALECIT